MFRDDPLSQRGCPSYGAWYDRDRNHVCPAETQRLLREILTLLKRIDTRGESVQMDPATVAEDVRQRLAKVQMRNPPGMGARM